MHRLPNGRFYTRGIPLRVALSDYGQFESAGLHPEPGSQKDFLARGLLPPDPGLDGQCDWVCMPGHPEVSMRELQGV